MYESKKLKKFVVDYVTEYVASATNPECGEDPYQCLKGRWTVDEPYQIRFGFNFLVDLYKEAYEKIHVRQIKYRLDEHIHSYLALAVDSVLGNVYPYEVQMWTTRGWVKCFKYGYGSVD